VENIAEKRAAVDVAARVLLKSDGWTVDDRLYVKPTEHREDHELREQIEAAFGNESVFRDYTVMTEVAGNTETVHDAGTDDRLIKAAVSDGAITLSGRVESLSHSRLAEVLMWRTDGCRYVDNELEVAPPAPDTDDDITDVVRIVLEMDPLVHADQLVVGTAGGVVVLTGSVASREEKKLAILDAWHVPGVADVVDRIESRD
jgi:osmotically-inducible protein OsmY